MSQVLSVLSPVTGYLSSLRFPSFYYRNEERTFDPRKESTKAYQLTDVQEIAENVKATFINGLPFLGLVFPTTSRWISYGSSMAALVKYIGRIHTNPTYENCWGAIKNIIELASTCYRLKAGLFMHSAMDLGESIYQFSQEWNLEKLLPAVSSGTYLLTLLPTSKKVHDALVCTSMICHAGVNLYQAHQEYTLIDKTTEQKDLRGRWYFALGAKTLLGCIRLIQACKWGYRLTQDESPVRRTVVIMRPASQQDPETGGLTAKEKADAKAITSVVDRVAAEHGGKPVIYVSDLGNSQETGDIIGGSLKRPVGIIPNDNLTEQTKIGVLGERQDELAHRLDGAVRDALNQTDPQTIPFLVTHGDIAKKYVDELRDRGVDVPEIFQRRLHTGEMIVLRRTGDEIVLVERIRAKTEISAPASNRVPALATDKNTEKARS